uniref:MFS transporter, UMF1 family n=1 Tax=Candidatus Kentrum sp. TUN TaxID=2126343 RepID=A0A451A6H2_9GAMM|nr:MAG: MFS transporter, UMF1 family [Candidatus Kentron sp. TUN]VFK55503.1 MAG: MFS transporter, UMF1 family [Candidatus Kentron sp. TUN]VFK61635.1 MAG: MFS transporter, UMF1 family [Candidatus Kentron sp. TUN]
MRYKNQVIIAWVGYDWANSAFTTLVVTFVYATYFSQAIAPDEVTGITLWSRAVAISGIFIALLAPFLGTLADRGKTRHRYLIAATLICITATAILTFIKPGQPHAVLLALVIFVIANVAFEIGTVFYNAFLPAIAPPGKIGRISGFGWGLGYLGGLVCLLMALLILIRDIPLFGISTTAGFNYRASNLLVAVWFLVFSIPTLFLLRTPKSRIRESSIQPTTTIGLLRDFRQTFNEISAYRDTLRFFIARLVYNDGMVTIFAFGGIYAASTFDMSLSEVIQFGIGINVAAGIGAWLSGPLDDRFGGKTIILTTLIALAGFTLLAATAPNKTWIWIAGIGIGIFSGPNQAASRSLLGRFAPVERRNQFFGLFAFSGKITAFIGPLLLGLVTQWTGNQRIGITTVLGFFLVGGILLLTVKEERGIALSKHK